MARATEPLKARNGDWLLHPADVSLGICRLLYRKQGLFTAGQVSLGMPSNWDY